MAKKPVKGRTYVSLSFSIPPEGEEPINQRAAQLGLSRSQYIWNLAQRDLYMSNLLPVAAKARDVPPRIRRNKKKPPSNGSD
jgi:hypothetical protein